MKLNIVAHLLRENGFPAGTSELALNADALDALQITKKKARMRARRISRSCRSSAA